VAYNATNNRHDQVTWMDERRSSCIQVLTGSKCTANDDDEELSSNLGRSQYIGHGGNRGLPELRNGERREDHLGVLTSGGGRRAAPDSGGEQPTVELGGSRTSRRWRPYGAPPVMGTSMMGAARPRGSPGGLGLVHRRFLASNQRRPAAVPGLADELARRRRGTARREQARRGVEAAARACGRTRPRPI
jgi:hypothetical protein